MAAPRRGVGDRVGDRGVLEGCSGGSRVGVQELLEGVLEWQAIGRICYRRVSCILEEEESHSSCAY